MGKGSTFKILLPAVIGKPKPAQAVLFDQELRGSGVVLVVDDEEVVRSAARGALSRYGYTVLTAEDGEAGVRIFRERANDVALVLLDMTMPVMSGAEAFRLIRGIRPDAKVIVSSGYNEVEAIRRFTAKGIAAFIQKPYTAAGLARVVKQALTGTVGLAEG
jgi:CheY-like chemotaxis protein